MGNLKENLGLVESTGLLLPVIAAASAWKYSRKYMHSLMIEPDEKGRYFDKSRNLALCYVGFAQKNVSFSQATGAGKAAFLSCAYDVVSDWKKPPALRENFVRILESETSSELTQMALDLLDRDVKGVLLYDGLERGIVATHFVLEMMGLKKAYQDKGIDIDGLGINMQIVDDVLDYEGDLESDDQNCSTSPKRVNWLSQMVTDLREESVENYFPYGGVLAIAVRRARDKGIQMLAQPENFFRQ